MDSDNKLYVHCPRPRTQRSSLMLCSTALNMASFRNSTSPEGEARDHHRSSPGDRIEGKALVQVNGEHRSSLTNPTEESSLNSSSCHRLDAIGARGC